MGEQEPHASPFAGMSDRQLIGRMEAAPDFGYDDEEVELSRRLKLGGLAWRWSNDMFNPRVEIYEPEPTFDFSGTSEDELIEIMLDINEVNAPKGRAAEEEYLRRRAEVINRALTQRALDDE